MGRLKPPTSFTISSPIFTLTKMVDFYGFFSGFFNHQTVEATAPRHCVVADIDLEQVEDVMFDGRALRLCFLGGGNQVVYRGPPKPTFLEVFMVNHLVFRWPKPLFFMGLGAHGSYTGLKIE